MNPLLGIGMAVGAFLGLGAVIKDRAIAAEDAEFWDLIKETWYGE